MANQDGDSPVNKQPAGKYFENLASKNLDLLNANYELVKSQTKNSFLLCMFGSLAGFLTLASGVVMVFLGISSLPIAAVTAISGVLVEAISAIFFNLYSRTVRQLKKYHADMVRVQNMMLVFKITEDAPDENSRNIMLHKILEWFVPRDPAVIQKPGVKED